MDERNRKNHPDTRPGASGERDAADELFARVYSQDIELPEKIGRRVTVLSCIAYSERQQVYLVRDRKKRKLILKLARGDMVSFLRRDAVMLRGHSFSFLPACVYYTEQAGNGYLLREYIEGDTLWEWVNRRGVFRFGEANDIICRLCAMLDRLHRLEPPVIHRDIKPQNIVLTADGRLYLIDMGTARRQKKKSVRDTLPVGSAPTAAPEQYGYRQTDCRTDIYALGVLYLFLLTGSMNVREMTINKTLPDPVRRTIVRCTRMDPDDRYQTCAQLCRAIRRTEIRDAHRKKKHPQATKAKNPMQARLCGPLSRVKQ